MPLRILVKQGVQWLRTVQVPVARQAVRESFVLASRSPGPCHFPGAAPPCSHVPMFPARKRAAKVLEKQRKNREKKQIRQQNKKKKGKKNKDSKKNVSSNVRIDGFENTDANL